MNKTIIRIVLASFLLLTVGTALAMADGSDAASDAPYGTISEFNLAPGFRWTCTPTYPSDLSVSTIILKQGTNIFSGSEQCQ